jgi:hypothetical protein
VTARRACPAIDRPAAQEFSPKNHVRVETDLSNRINVICPVQTSREKYSAFAVGQISDLNPPVSPDKRGGSRSSRNVRWDAVDADALLTNGA